MSFSCMLQLQAFRESYFSPFHGYLLLVCFRFALCQGCYARLQSHLAER